MNTIGAHGPLISYMPMKFSKGLRQEFSSSKFSLSRSNPLIFRCCSNKNEKSQESQMGFSVLKKDIECDRGIIYSTMAFYVFSLHIPLSFGGLAIVATILHQQVLEPQTEALALLGLEILEFVGFVLLLKRPGEPQYKLLDLFQIKELAGERSWLLASLIGFLFLLLLVLVTFIADQFLGTKLYREASGSTIDIFYALWMLLILSGKDISYLKPFAEKKLSQELAFYGALHNQLTYSSRREKQIEIKDVATYPDKVLKGLERQSAKLARLDYKALVQNWYSLSTYGRTWAPLFHPIPDNSYWPPEEEMVLIPRDVMKRNCKGRPKSARLHNGMDAREGQTKGTCSLCKQKGHNKQRCSVNKAKNLHP